MRSSILIALVALCVRSATVDATSLETSKNGVDGTHSQHTSERTSSDIMTADEARKSWPELVGMNGEEAKAQLQAALPGKKIMLVPKDSMVTMDYRTDRVRIFVDSEGNVARTPTLG
jgi:hypothetical protein